MTKKHIISAEVQYLIRHANELANKGHYQQAVEQYDKAIEQVPDFACFWNCKGVALEKMNRITEALACYEKAVETDPAHLEADFNREVALRRAEHR